MRTASLAWFTILSLAACGGGGVDHDHDGGTDATVDGPGPSDGGDAGAMVDAGTGMDGDVPAPDGGMDAGLPPGTRYVLVGLATGDLVTLDALTLAETSRTPTGSFPSFVAAAPDGRHVYAVNESDDELVSLAVSASGATTIVNRRPCGGGPTHVSVDATGTFAFTASYGSGEVRVYPIAPDGSLMPASDTDFAGSHAHETVPAPGGFLYVPCLGADIIVVYTVDATGTLTRRSMGGTDPGAGPRHMAFSPDHQYAYVLDELMSELDAYTVDTTTGALARLQTISTLPAGFTGTDASAEVLVSADGRFVYASNRGADDVAVFTRSATTGRLTSLSHEPSGGMHPRSMALTQGGARMLVANRDSNNLVSLAVSTDGSLAFNSMIAMPGMPYFVIELDAPPP